MKTKVVSIADKEEWNEVVTRSGFYDFYHCNVYHSLDKLGAPFLYVAEDGDDFIALPLIKRKIENSDYFDCTSVWGYPGPVSSIRSDELRADFIAYFQKEIRQYLLSNKIIAAFSRLHPIIPQQHFLDGLGTITALNKTVAIDLTLPPDVQRQQYRKSNKSEINQLRRNGYTVKRAETLEEIKAFYEIYIETMERVNANFFYFDCFSLEYFNKLLHLDDARSNLLLAFKDGQIIAGGVFIATEKLMQYHVAGTKAQYMRATPMKLIVDEARLLANQMNLKYLHLGGGVNGTDEDSLFQFKAGFSNQTFHYKVWKYIVNEDIYNYLVRDRARERQLDPAFFPLYRG